MVDLDSCLTKKPVEDSACHPYNTRGSMSEVQSLSSFQSESCDDNGMLPFSMLHLSLLVKLTRQHSLKNARFYNTYKNEMRCHFALVSYCFFLLSDQPAGFCNSYLCLVDFDANTVSLHAQNGWPKRWLWGHMFFSLSFCCGVSAPIWIKSVHRSRTRF